MGKTSDKTNVMRVFDKMKINYKIREYLDSGAVGGMEVAEALGQNPDSVFKTLVVVGKSGAHYVFLVPVNKELNLKKAAERVGEKKVEMIKSKDLLSLTGYVHGGCSPVGMKKTFKTIIDKSAENYDYIMFSGGKIGYQVETTLAELRRAVNYTLEDVASE